MESFKLKALGDNIDKGKYIESRQAHEYFYGRPPYQYTNAEPKNFQRWGDSQEERKETV